MGDAEKISARSCSRLGYSLAHIASHIKSEVPLEAEFTVLGFDRSFHTIVNNNLRDCTFDVNVFVDTCICKIKQVNRGGTHFYDALVRTVRNCSTCNTEVHVYTDGEATDTENRLRAERCLGIEALRYSIKILLVSSSIIEWLLVKMIVTDFVPIAV